MPRIRPIEWLFPVLAVSALMLLCVLTSARQPFWVDELLSHYPLADRSLASVASAQADLINTIPPFYFVLAWPYAQVFGAGELSLRLFSCLGVAVALVATWWVCRRVFGFWPASVAVTVGFFGSALVVSQASEARFYGLMLAEMALAVLLAMKLMLPARPGWLVLLANTLTHAALVTTHYFGFLYSGAILAALVVLSLNSPRRLGLCVGSILVGWLAFIPCIPAFLHHLDFAQPKGFIPRPGKSALYDLFADESALYGPAALLLIGVAVAVYFRRRDSGFDATEAASPQEVAQQWNMAVLALCLALVAPLVWVVSLVGPSMFVPRYFIADVLVWTFAFACGTRAAVSSAGAARRLPHAVFLLIILGYLVMPITHTSYLSRPAPWEAAQQGTPVALEKLNEFLPRYYYAHSPEQYFYVIDADAELDPKLGPAAANSNRIATALKRHYPDLPIVTAEEFLAQHDDFIVLDDPERVWFEQKIRNNPEFRCEPLADTPQRWRTTEGAAASGMKAYRVLRMQPRSVRP